MEAGSVDIIPDTVHILVDSVEKGVNNLLNKSPPTIYMVPSSMRDLSPNSFNPRRVSIGPLHKQDKNVQEIEEEKPVILGLLLKKVNSSQEEPMKACVEKVSARLHDIRACYEGLNAYKDVELAKMMVMDACFLLFLFLSHEEISLQVDKAFSLSLVSDLVLLENQIPFFVLQDIFECTVLKFQPTADLNKMLLNILKVVKPFETELNAEIHGTNTKYDHILHFLHSSYKQPTNESRRDHSVFVPPSYPVRELEKAGVIFKRNEDNRWALAINFKSSWCKPTLTLPLFRINVYTELVFFNLIAYEQRTTPAYFTSYVVAMMNLLETKEDHHKLVDLKIARNNPSGSQYVVDLIHNLSKGSDLKDFLYDEDWDKMNDYCNSPLGWTRRTYFSSAWSYIASISGFIVFILTVIQTYCSIHGK